ncbi:GFA family protein [Azospirillum griseum]|uniref:GFA family protein n=1 Tax=Azospirillum griseum TaxID=2496639 RepID=UPI00157523B3|nr:GFA family protein [Azospirillum griseum]
MSDAPNPSPDLTGRCLCGGVRFHLTERPLGVANCHCGQCRRFHGHVGAYVSLPRPAVVFDAEDSLRWFRSSDHAQRGFCGTCGSSLFWMGDSGGRLDVAAGCLDAPTGLATLRHIFVADQGDYYRIPDDSLDRFPGTTTPSA